MDWLLLLVILGGTVVTFVLGVLASPLSKNVRSAKLLLGVVALLVLGTVFAYAQAMRESVLPNGGPSAEPSPNQFVPDPTSPAPSSAQPDPSTSTTSGRPSSGGASQEPKETPPTRKPFDGYMAGPGLPTMASDGTTTDYTFYKSYNSVLGDIEETQGGVSGTIGIARIGTGKGCTTPYALYFFNMLRPTQYTLEAHVPDVDDLGRAIMGPDILDQAEVRGRWVSLGESKPSRGADGNYSITVEIEQPRAPLKTGEGCQQTGEVVAFDAIRISLP